MNEFFAQLSDQARALIPIWADCGCDHYDINPAGTILAVNNSCGLIIACGRGCLLVRSGKIEGKKLSYGQAMIQQLGVVDGDRFNAELA